MYPDMVAVFLDTGLEYPEIRDFVKKFDNVVWVKPAMTFKEVVEKYGFPVISKNVAMAVDRYRTTKREDQKYYRLYGRTRDDGHKDTVGVIPKKWRKLIHAPFKVSERCCDALKKRPARKFEKESGLKPFVGLKAVDSHGRKLDYLQNGCILDGKKASCRPLAFWTDADIDEYIAREGLELSEIYNMGADHTGCMFCMFGVHMEPKPNRFQRMELTHPKQWNYCINKLGCGQVLDYIGVPYKNTQKKIEDFG